VAKGERTVLRRTVLHFFAFFPKQVELVSSVPKSVMVIVSGLHDVRFDVNTGTVPQDMSQNVRHSIKSRIASLFEYQMDINLHQLGPASD
jgi:hypothetical protein